MKSAAHCITPVSVYGQGRPCAHRRSTPFHVGASNASAKRCSCATNGLHLFENRFSQPVGRTAHPPSVIIIGGGAAGLAAADMLRREGYDMPITMISAGRLRSL